MTKFETLLKLSEIKGALVVAESKHVPLNMVNELIDDLLNDDDECQTTAGNCGYCGGFHD